MPTVIIIMNWNYEKKNIWSFFSFYLDNVTAIAKSVVSLALDTFQKSQIQPIQQLTSTQLIGLKHIHLSS